jgi:hypothetical protein
MAETLEAGLVFFLKATAAVATLVGARVYPDQTPPGVSGARIVVKRVKESRDRTLAGRTPESTAEVLIQCYGTRWASGYTASRSIADAVLAADGGLGGQKLESYGNTLAAKFDTVVIQAVRCDNDTDQSEPPRDSSDHNEEWVELTLVISYIKQS